MMSRQPLARARSAPALQAVAPHRAVDRFDPTLAEWYGRLTPRDEAALHMAVYASSQSAWLGHQMQQNPLDLMAIHDILWQCRPEILVETGTWKGGSALYYATLMDGLDYGQILTIDVNEWIGWPQHPRIHYVPGSSVEARVVEIVRSITQHAARVMVILDADHTEAHVAEELRHYAPMVTVGQYLIVEDTNIHGHPIRGDLPAGPFEAVQAWLPAHPEFVLDRHMEPIVSHHPQGYLRRVAADQGAA